MSATEPAGEPLLEAMQVRKEFGGLVAVNDVDFTIPRGSIVSLIGPNGAGKTTFFNMLTGRLQADRGRDPLQGRRLDRRCRRTRSRRSGMARTFQNIRLFHNMTRARERAGRDAHAHQGRRLGVVFRTTRLSSEERSVAKRARELLDYVGLAGARRRVREEPAVRRPAAARGRARARDRAEAAAARRADRRHEPAGDGAVHRAVPRLRDRAGDDGAADRARHEAS